MRIDRAIDLYLGDLARQGKSKRTLATYGVRLMPLCGPKEIVEPRDVRDVTADDLRAYLDTWRDAAAGTRYHAWAVLSGFFKWLYRAELIDLNPMGRIEPPKRIPPEDLDVVTLSGAGVEATPHSLRAAFAVEFLETHPGELDALQRLLGHRKSETTQIYLRRLDREKQMERVRDLTWGNPFGAIAVEAPSGFEPL